MPANPSVSEASAWLVGLVGGCLDLTRDNLGGALLRSQAARIADRATNEEGSEGRWDENTGAYGEQKRKKGVKVGVGLGRKKGGRSKMLGADQMAGKASVKPREATLTYGKSDQARRKLEWFENGSSGTDGEHSGASNQPARPMWEFSESDQAELDREVDAAVESFLDGR